MSDKSSEAERPEPGRGIAAAQFSARGSNAPLSCTFESFRQENDRDFDRNGKQIKPKPDHMHDSFGPEEERVRKENVRLEERTRIAQELHDTLLQSFLSASIQLGLVLEGIPPDSPVKPRLDRVLQITHQAIEEGRNAIRDLRSSDSHISDLVLALSRIQEELEVPPDIDFRVIVTGRQKQLPSQTQHEIYRIGRESLVNAFCHSGAKRVELEVEYSDSELRMRIRDNGCGIDPEVLEKGRDGHWGLGGMRERATRIGGLLKILSSPTAGTEVQLSIPSRIALELSPPHHSSE